jgi:S-adenosylmethionine:tRNA ribosyltransferase-isomerase
LDLSEFDYHLPEESIAQQPLEDRAASRMLVLYRQEQRWEDWMFRDFPSFLKAGDCLVLNDSKVFPSRLFGHRVGVHALRVGTNNPKQRENLSGTVEVLLLRPISADAKTWEALVRPGRKIRVGERIQFENPTQASAQGAPTVLQAEIIARGAYGERTLRFETGEDTYQALEVIGHVPLPPYIKRPDTSEDRERYQTVFAKQNGSVAAPTAGLHFTPEILGQCSDHGAEIVYVTLHVGLGTFQPVRGETLHMEHFSISDQAAATIKAARRVICAGTTSVRAVESMLLGKSGETDLFIRPGFGFRRTDAMLTNFHLPQSSLLMLVCAFAGRELVLSAYRHAVEAGYRFYSYGDCMLVV